MGKITKLLKHIKTGNTEEAKEELRRILKEKAAERINEARKG